MEDMEDMQWIWIPACLVRWPGVLSVYTDIHTVMDIPREEEEGGAGVLDLVCLFVCLNSLLSSSSDTRLGLDSAAALPALSRYLPWLYYLAILARCLFPIFFFSPRLLRRWGWFVYGGWGMVCYEGWNGMV